MPSWLRTLARGNIPPPPRSWLALVAPIVRRDVLISNSPSALARDTRTRSLHRSTLPQLRAVSGPAMRVFFFYLIRIVERHFGQAHVGTIYSRYYQAQDYHWLFFKRMSQLSRSSQLKKKILKSSVRVAGARWQSKFERPLAVSNAELRSKAGVLWATNRIELDQRLARRYSEATSLFYLTSWTTAESETGFAIRSTAKPSPVGVTSRIPGCLPVWGRANALTTPKSYPIADIKYTSRLTWPRCSYPAQVWLLEHPRVDKLTPLFRDQPPSTPSTTKDCPAGPLGHCPSTKNVSSFPAAVSAASKTLAPPTHPNWKARYTLRQGRAAPPPNRTYSQPNARPGAGAPCRSTAPSVWGRAGRSAVEDSGGLVSRLSGTFRAARMRSAARGLTRGRKSESLVKDVREKRFGVTVSCVVIALFQMAV
ncbi:hypothetical protein BJV77DRAFT_964228 [Russula vinacea]|nr:hypothetical protein BJV77DRAFT_964228 [Russula vinacea]